MEEKEQCMSNVDELTKKEVLSIALLPIIILFVYLVYLQENSTELFIDSQYRLILAFFLLFILKSIFVEYTYFGDLKDLSDTLDDIHWKASVYEIPKEVFTRYTNKYLLNMVAIWGIYEMVDAFSNSKWLDGYAVYAVLVITGYKAAVSHRMAVRSEQLLDEILQKKGVCNK